MPKFEPLAHRMRPTKIEEVVGQKHLLGENKPIYQMIANNHVTSMILYGPPGIGKTTIASAISGSVDMPFRALNGVTDGKKEIEAVITEAKEENVSYLLYIDEIHRLTKTQSEPLLPAVENGTVVLIGSTTESVYHALPSGILSRCALHELKPLESDDIVIALKRALYDTEKGLGEYPALISEAALYHLADTSGGDARSALNGLESVVISHVRKLSDEPTEVTLEMIEESTKKKSLGWNGEDSRYDLMSAFQKSIRGSDVNAALYYLGILIESGDLTSITRRLLVIADEDIGMGNVHASTHALTAVQIAERIGFPEARIPLAKIVVELCLSPKSNTAHVALDAAMTDIQKNGVAPIPNHLRDAHYKGAKDRGHGIGYEYPHNHTIGGFGGWFPQDYLPDKLKNVEFYSAKEIGDEKQYAQIYKKLKEIKSEFKKKNNT